MTAPPLEAVATAIITGLAGVVLLGALVASNHLLRLISERLSALQQALGSIGSATEPLPDRVAAVATNVAKLKDVVTNFNVLLAERTVPISQLDSTQEHQ